MEYKSTPLEIKAEGDQGVVEGYFAVFNNVDDGNDIIVPGAFHKTLQERGERIKVFYGHDWTRLIAPPPEVLQEDNIGLFARFKLVLDSFWGGEAWALIKDKALTEGSIGYEAVKSHAHDLSDLEAEEFWGADWKNDHQRRVRKLAELRLFEISPVPLGMNPRTIVRGIKCGAIPEDQHLALITELIGQIKSGQMLATASFPDLCKVKESLTALSDALHEKLEAAKPVADHSALLAARFRMAELAMYQLELSH